MPAPAPAAPDMDLETARVIVERFRLSLRNPSAVIGRDYLDRAALLDAPARIEAALVTLGCERAEAGDQPAVAMLRELMRTAAGAVAPEVAEQMRAFHAKLPNGPEATLTGITIRIEEALATTDFVTQAARQAAEQRRALSTFDGSVTLARRRRLAARQTVPG
ncbi:hypothetical protein [Muricoccus radiodurans]|uniref:hypothetical protein n=1 Tax=Muricoccus radiodurans TaxID=2231721 RepID=UPI003CF7227B